MATAIVTAGAGARGAYEAGVLSKVLPKLLEDEDEIVLVGTSAGALNAAVLAGAADRSAEAVTALLTQMWRNLEVGKVFTIDPKGILAYGAQIIGLPRAHSYALLDTSPLRDTVTSGGGVDWATLSEKFDGTWLKAAGIVTTEVETGKSVVFVEGLGTNLPLANGGRGIDYRRAALAPDHVLASAAIPILFPTVNVLGSGWFVDGGVRLNTPIAPAIDLLSKVAPGRNNRIVIVSTEPDPNVPRHSSRPIADRRPDILDEAVAFMYASLVDRVAEDVQSLRRVNAVMQSNAKRRVPDHRSPGESFQIIDHCYFGPQSRGELARRAGMVFKTRPRWPPSVFDLVSRVIGNKGATHDEFLSFLYFEQGFLRKLIELGQKDADRLMIDGRLPWSTDGSTGDGSPDTGSGVGGPHTQRAG